MSSFLRLKYDFNFSDDRPPFSPEKVKSPNLNWIPSEILITILISWLFSFKLLSTLEILKSKKPELR